MAEKIKLPEEVLDNYKFFIEYFLNNGLNDIIDSTSTINSFTIDKDVYIVELKIRKRK